MNLEPILNAPFAVQLHVFTVVPAFLIGTWLIFFSTKGARFHRALGYTYLVLMTITSIAAVFIHAISPNGFMGWSFIHLFVPLTLFGVFGALRGAWTHDIPLHKRSMIGVYIGGILIAGGFAFMPGRIMHAVIFG